MLCVGSIDLAIIGCIGGRSCAFDGEGLSDSYWDRTCVAVTVFPKTVADDYPMLQTPSKAKIQCGVRQASARSERVKSPSQAQRWVSSVREPESCRHQAVCVPTGSGTKLELERVNGVHQLPVEFVPYSQSTSENNISGTTFGAGADRRCGGQHCEGRPLEQTGACSAVSPAEGARLEFPVVGASSGSRDVIFPIPGGGLLEARPAVPGGRERTQREEEWQRWKVMQLNGPM